MKFFKTAMAAVLGLGFVFSAVGCEEVEPTSGGGKDTLFDPISFSVTANVDWDLETATLNSEGLEEFSNTVEMDLSVKMDVSFNGETVDAKLDVTSPMLESEMGVDTINAYLIDGSIFVKNPAADNEWMCAATGLNEQLKALLAEEGVTKETISETMDLVLSEMAGLGITPELIGTEIYNAFEQYATVENDYFVFVADGKELLNSVIDYAGTLSATTTVRGMIDGALAMVDESLTCEQILSSVAELNLGEMTIGSIYTYADNIVKEETGLSIQENYAAIIANEDVLQILVEYMQMPEEDLAELKALNIETLIEDIKDVTVDELIAMTAEEGQETYTVAEMIALATEALDSYTLNDIDSNLPALMAEIAACKVDALYTKSGVKYDKNKKITDMFEESKIDFEGALTLQDEYDGAMYTYEMHVCMTTKLAVNGIKNSVKKIALPKGAKIVTPEYDIPQGMY